MELCVPLRWIVAWLCVVAGPLLGSAGAARAADIQPVGVPLAVCVARAAPGTTPEALFATPARFDCTTPQTAFGPGDFWVLSAPLPPGRGVDRQLAVRQASLWQRKTTLYARYADGEIFAMQTDDHALSHRLQLGAIVQHDVPVRGIAVTRLLWHVEGSANLRGIVSGSRLATPAESARANVRMAAFYAAFFGLCVTLLFYNLALWGALRHRFQLYYCAMVVALMVYAVSSSGALAWIVPEIANTDRMRVNYLMLGLSGVGALAFARSFFEERVFAGWLGTWSSGVIALILTTSIGYVALAPWHIALLDRVFSLSFIALIGLVAPILWRAWHERSKYLWLFAFSWALPIVFGGVRIFDVFYPRGWNFWLDNSTILSMTVETLLSSLAIAYRIRQLSNERDDARAQEIAARVLADTDPLTGLFNRRAFLRGAIGREHEQILLIADIDHFKRVNETIGHDGGDEVLRVFARTLRASVPPEAMIARLGGEEFAILTPATHPVKAEAVLARLRAARMPYDLTVTASMGVCQGTILSEADWKGLYRCCDRALFEAKAAGRDRAREGRRAA